MNRIVGRREAIVEERPGVTRDRKEVEAEWGGRALRARRHRRLAAPAATRLDDKVSRQSEKAMADADAVLFVVDAATGVTDEDARVAEVVRRAATPVLLVANKVDDDTREAAIWDLLALGLGEPRPVIARCTAAAPATCSTSSSPASRPRTTSRTPATTTPTAPTTTTRSSRVAIVGRPNVGKSTLFNRLIGEDRAVVHDLPGTTRDTIDTVVETEDGPIRFVDTAGMRRQGQDRRGHRVLLAGAGAAGRRPRPTSPCS